MYAFYSMLVYIFYTVFKKEEETALEGACGETTEVYLSKHTHIQTVYTLMLSPNVLCNMVTENDW